MKAYYEVGEYAKAELAYKNLDHPDTEDKIVLAKVYAAKGMILECMQTYDDALKNTDERGFLKSKFQYAKILQTQNKLSKADSIYSSLLEIMPDHAEILYQKGKIAQAYDKLAYHQFFLDALLYDSTHIKAAHEASRYFMEVDNLSMAKNICLKTLKLVPNTPRLINLLAQIYYREEHYEKSLDYIQHLETLKPDLPKFIYEIKGNNYLKLKLYKDALDAYEDAFNKANKDYNLALKLAEISLILENFDKAHKYLKVYEMLKDTSMWEFNYLLGKVYMHKKRYSMAFYQFQKAYHENSNHEASLYYRAVAADNFMKDKSKALDYYTNYIETFEDEKGAKFVEVALRREAEIRRELFMKE
jgi:hypothetical protein